jgi:hypothetical protein
MTQEPNWDDLPDHVVKVVYDERRYTQNGGMIGERVVEFDRPTRPLPEVATGTYVGKWGKCPQQVEVIHTGDVVVDDIFIPGVIFTLSNSWVRAMSRKEFLDTFEPLTNPRGDK